MVKNVVVWGTGNVGRPAIRSVVANQDLNLVGVLVSNPEKVGQDACPFNYLYWNFLARNRQKIGGNPRLGMIYRTYDRMSAEKQASITINADRFLNELV